jgi:hypothetical protein
MMCSPICLYTSLLAFYWLPRQVTSVIGLATALLLLLLCFQMQMTILATVSKIVASTHFVKTFLTQMDSSFVRSMIVTHGFWLTHK